MNKLGVFGIILSSLIILALQVLIFKDLVLFGNAFCFFYVLIFLMLPVDTNPLLQMVVGFSIGLLIDAFYSTQGVHASASTLLMFLRPFWIKAMSPGSGYGAAIKINIRSQGFQWFITYIGPLVFLHSLALFLIEAFGFNNFLLTIKKVLFSSLFTTLVIVIVQYLIVNRDEKKR